MTVACPPDGDRPEGYYLRKIFEMAGMKLPAAAIRVLAGIEQRNKEVKKPTSNGPRGSTDGRVP